MSYAVDTPGVIKVVSKRPIPDIQPHEVTNFPSEPQNIKQNQKNNEKTQRNQLNLSYINDI